MREKLIQILYDGGLTGMARFEPAKIIAETLRCDKCKYLSVNTIKFTTDGLFCYNEKSPVFDSDRSVEPDFFCSKWESKNAS